MDTLGSIKWIYQVTDLMEQQSALTSSPTPDDFARIFEEFPNLRQFEWEFTSDPTESYNCIAFAAGITQIPWWPTPFPVKGCYWPPEVPREETLRSFVLAFRTLGYRVCDNGKLEEGYEKIVIYTKDDAPKHAAIQTSTGAWKSKLGGWVDIQHAAPEALNGDNYGRPVRFMRRRIAGHQASTSRKASKRSKLSKSRD